MSASPQSSTHKERIVKRLSLSANKDMDIKGEWYRRAELEGRKQRDSVSLGERWNRE